MEKSITFVITFIIISFLSSCYRIDNFMVRKDGRWNIDKEIITFSNGVSSTTNIYSDFGTITFNDDGSGIIDYNTSSSEEFTWTVDNDVFHFTYVLTGDVMDFDIIESSKNMQHWNGISTVGGVWTFDIILSSLN